MATSARASERNGHDHCPRCGNLNGPFERLGTGICNECLTKRVHRSRAQQARRRRERGEIDERDERDEREGV